MKGKRIISLVITLLFIINIFPSLLFDNVYADYIGDYNKFLERIRSSSFGDNQASKYSNIAWIYPEGYRYGIQMAFDMEWIYGDGTAGYKVASNMSSIPINALWAFPRHARMYSESDILKASENVYYHRRGIDGKTHRAYGHINNLPADTFYVEVPTYTYKDPKNYYSRGIEYGIYLEDYNIFTSDTRIAGFGDYNLVVPYKSTYRADRENETDEPSGNAIYRYKPTPYVFNARRSAHTVVPFSVSPIGNRDAFAHGELIHSGAANVTQHGHVWSTSPHPDVDNASKTELGSKELGKFTSKITDLKPNTKYYIRAYAINKYGVNYGPEETFTTLATTTKGYKYVHIGDKQSFKVPNGINEIIITAKGASGAYIGGQGGIMKAKLTPIAGQVLYINVGGADGYNGGGAAYLGLLWNYEGIPASYDVIEDIPYKVFDKSYYALRTEEGSTQYNLLGIVDARYGTVGGGATDIRIGGVTLEDRIMVVGGGGAGGSVAGGDGSGIPGVNGNRGSSTGSVVGGGGGTSNSGGSGGSGSGYSYSGKLGQGGHAFQYIDISNNLHGSAGGGGGYYGGGAGGSKGNRERGATAGGGGGSAYLAPNLNLIEGKVGGNSGHGEVILEFPNKAPTIKDLKPNGTDIHTSSNINITWTDNDPDKDPLERTIKIETLDGKVIYEGKPSGENNHALNAVNLINLDWNGSRYEKKVKVTVTVDDLYGGVATATSQFTIYNHRPNVSISNPSLPTNVNDSFTLTGKVSDSNRDTVTIKATIDGKTKTITISNPPSSTPSSDNWSLTWTDLKEGNYSNIKIIVTDDKGSYEEILWGGSLLIKDVLKIIDNAIQDNILPNADNKTRVILGNTNVGIAENSNNNKTISSIKSNVSNRESELFFVGQKGNTKNYIENKLTDHYGIYGENYVDSLVDLILSMNSTKDSNVFVVGDFVEMDMLFTDTEKDYEGISVKDKLKTNEELQALDNEKENLKDIIMKAKDGTLQAKYNHDPDIFDNPAGVHPKSNGEYRVIEDIEDNFIIKRAEKSMRGQWTLTMKGSDSTGKPLFDKFSNDETITFIIHEKPTAKIKYAEDSNNYYLTGENSYDIDYQYRDKFPDNTDNKDKGIVRYQWHYQLEDGTWYKLSKEGKRVTMPKTIAGKKITGYGLTVTDYHGATDTTRETELISTEFNAKLHPELDKFNLNNPGIPASENIKVIDIETIPFAPDKLEFALYQNSSRKTPLKTLTNPGDLLISDHTYYKWKDIRNYNLPKELPDGNYIAEIKEPKANTKLIKNWNVKVHTPINLKPTMPKELIAGDTYKLTATTSKYATDVRVLLYSDKKGNTNVFSSSNPDTLKLNLVKQENEIKYWEVNYTVPEGTKDSGDYVAKFVAKTPQPLASLPWKEGVGINPNPEVVYKNFYLENLDLRNLRITNMVNHIEYDGKYPILYNNPSVPVNYKAGYYVTFKINAIGKPDTVKMKISHPGYNKEFNMIKESESGNDSVWKLDWYSDPFLKKGTIINTNVTARKNTTSINFNSKYNFNGDYLKTSGSIESDWRIDQEL